MKKLAHVLVLPKLAGSQHFCLSLLSSLTEYDRYVLVSESEDVPEIQKREFINRFENIGVTIIWCRHLRRNIGFHDFKAIKELYSIFKEYRFDIVHTNSTKPGIIGRIAARFAGAQFIVHTVHGISFYKGQSFLKRLVYWVVELFAMQFGHVNITVNKYYLKYYKWSFWKRSDYIYNGLAFPLTDSNSKVCNKKNGKKLLFVGRLDSQKDPITLLKAFSIIINDYPDLILDVVGDGELYNQCRDFVSNHDLQSSVIFHGWVDEPSVYYRQADIFICPSIYEAFGLIFLEAAFFSLPIISTSVEGIPEVVDSKMGFLIEPRNHVELAKKITLLVKNRELRVRFGIEGKNIVTQKFDISHMIDAYRELYIK